jgi:cell fate regulator YaaT (PSP1 superfamily)
VVFSPGGKVYSFDPGELELEWNDRVICQTARGREYGRVVQAAYEPGGESPPGRLKRVVRRATDEDDERVQENRAEAKRAMAVFRELVRSYDVPMKAISAELVFDGTRLVFSYSSEGKVDTKRLVDELGRRLKRRIELRAVGPREQSRLCGGYGLCGTQLCCTRFPSHEQPITLRMAKDQDLPMSSGRITGLCGRLRCCLAYEHPMYRSFRDRAPRVGARVSTPGGDGVVRSYDVLDDSCAVELGEATVAQVKIDDCRELASSSQDPCRGRGGK